MVCSAQVTTIVEALRTIDEFHGTTFPGRHGARENTMLRYGAGIVHKDACMALAGDQAFDISS